MNVLRYSILCLLLCGGLSRAQLAPTGKIEPGVEEKFLSKDPSIAIVKKDALVSGKDFSIFSDTQKILFQQVHTGMPTANEGTLIATVKKNNNVSSAGNGINADYPGRVYVCWDDEKFYPGDSDVFLSYSDDSGATWTEPILVTYHPNHKTQFGPLMVTDQKGVVYIVYYDRQNSADNSLTDIYLAISKNGGLKFDYYRVNSKAFKFNGHKTIELLQTEPPIVAWTEKTNKVHAEEISDTILEAYNIKKANEEIQIGRSFVFSDTIKINFTLKEKSKISAIITKPLEPGFEKWILKNKKFKKGANSITVNTTAAGLKKGNYTVTLYYNNNNTYAWIIED